MDIGLPELIIILVILLLLFGSSRLPKLTRSIGESAKELKDAFSGRVDSQDAKEDAKTKNKK